MSWKTEDAGVALTNKQAMPALSLQMWLEKRVGSPKGCEPVAFQPLMRTVFYLLST
jgi:hypothetical protein